MKIWKEKSYYPLDDDYAEDIIAVVRLENDNLLIEYNNCTAAGIDGRRYVTVSKEVVSPIIPTNPMFVNVSIPEDQIPQDDPYDTNLSFLGWTAEAQEPVVIALDPSEI